MKKSMLAALTAFLLSAGFATPAAAESLVCSLGAGLGAAMTASRLDSGVAVDISGSGFVVAPDASCSIKSGPLSYGAMARYSIGTATANVSGTNFNERNRWSAAAKIGYDLNPHAMLYGLIGVSGTKIEVPAFSLSAAPNGLLLGAGLELDIGQGPLTVFAEVNRVAYSSKDLGATTVKPTDISGLVGLRYKLSLFSGQ